MGLKLYHTLLCGNPPAKHWGMCYSIDTDRHLRPVNVGGLWDINTTVVISFFIFFKFLNLFKLISHRGAQTHDPEIKSCMLHQLSQPGTPYSGHFILIHVVQPLITSGIIMGMFSTDTFIISCYSK